MRNPPCPNRKASGLLELAETEHRNWRIMGHADQPTVLLTRFPPTPVSHSPDDLCTVETEQYILPKELAEQYIRERSVEYALKRMGLI